MRDLALAVAAGVMLGLGALAASRVAYGQSYGPSSKDTAKTDAKTLVQVVDTWRLNHPNEPEQCPSIEQLKRDGALKLDQNTDDPWGNPYIVFCPHDTDLGVLSAGPDGRYGTADDIKAGDVP